MCFRYFLFFLLTTPLFAETKITTQIHEIDVGTRIGDEVLILLKSGDVARLESFDLKKIEELNSLKSKDQWFTFTLDGDRFVEDVKIANAPVIQQEKLNTLEEINYTPTTVASMKIATDYIREARSRVEREGTTQCFNRALVWTYDWWKKHSLRSMKMFIFWPKEYIRKYGFKWWFHVTPYVHVMDSDGVVKERALDVKWISRPYSMQDWADYHSSKDVKCRVVEKYSDYADNPFYSDRCYFMRANMYTWQPADLEMNEAWGYSKNAFNMDEVRAAFLEAFNIKL
jgi:hypothetical protein